MMNMYEERLHLHVPSTNRTILMKYIDEADIGAILHLCIVVRYRGEFWSNKDSKGPITSISFIPESPLWDKVNQLYNDRLSEKEKSRQKGLTMAECISLGEVISMIWKDDILTVTYTKTPCKTYTWNAELRQYELIENNKEETK